MDKCPMCGYAEQVGGVRVNTIMNNYVHEATGKVSCINSGEESIEQKDKDGNVIGKLIRQDRHKVKAPATSKPVEPVPVIKNHLNELPPTLEVPKPNPFASVKAPTPQEGPI